MRSRCSECCSRWLPGPPAPRASGVAGLVLLWASSCDMLDGELARVTGTAHPSGAFLDSTLDRIGEIGVLVGIAAGLSGRSGILVASAALAASLLVSYVRARGEGLGVACPPGGLERPQRLTIFIGALLASAFVPRETALVTLEAACFMVALGAGMTALARIFLIHRVLRRGSNAPSTEGHPGLEAADLRHCDRLT